MKRKSSIPRKQALGVCMLAAMANSAHSQIQTAGDLLIDLNFTTLTPGDLTFIPNPGTAGGGFEAIGGADTIPVIRTMPDSTVKALYFDGSDFMISVTEQTPLGGEPSRMDAPAGLAGSQPVRSVEAWVYNNAPQEEETVLAWGKRGGGDGQNFSCLYGWNETWGALGQWGGPDLPWGTLPPSGTWHHVTWVHTGPGDGDTIPPNTTLLYVDGVLSNQEDAGALNTHVTPILLGSQFEADGTTPTPALRGVVSIGKVRIHSGVLPEAAVLNNYDFEKAGFPATAPSATLASGPIHRWSFGEADGTKVADSVGAAHGQVKGAGYTWSGDGTQLDLGAGGASATAAYVDLPNRLISSHAPELGGSGEVTIEFWMTNTGSQNWARFFDFGSSVGAEVTGPGGGGEGFDYLTVTASVGTDVGRSLLSLRTHDTAGNGPLGAGGPDFQQESNYPTGTFTAERHVAVIWRDGKFLELYENGVPFREVRGNNGLTGLNGVKMVQLNDVNCWLGRSNWTADSNLAGTINEFRVYDRALTPAELLKNEADGPAATLPGPQDTDGDGLPNWFERQYANATMDYLVAGSPSQATLDGDTDGLNNLQEYQRGLNPIVADTDGDGLNDGAEITAGTDPLLADTDGDGLPDGAEVNTHSTNPLVADTDSDGYTDSQEVAGGSNPNNPTSIPVVFLAARYSFNDAAGPAAAGSVVVDSVSGLNGHVRGNEATWTGGTLQLPGAVTDPAYVDLPNRMISRFAKSKGGRGAVTLEGWVTVQTRSGSNAAWQRILDFGSTGPGGKLGEVFGPARSTLGDISGRDYIFVSGARGDEISQRRYDWTNNDPFGGTGVAFGGDTDASANTIDTEFQFALTIDENTGVMRYYENGVELSSSQGTLKLDALNDVNCWLGRSNWTADGAFQGSYNEFRVYAGTLSASDIAKSMTKGPATTAEGTNPATDITTLKVINANGWPEWWIDRNGGVVPAANSDSDSDGLTALQELGRGSDPTKADTDGDGLNDAAENNSGVFVSATSAGTDPANPDTDSDGLKDDAEVAAGSNPFDIDTDKDLAFDGSDAEPTNAVASSLAPAHRWTFDNLGADAVPDGTVAPDVAGGAAFPAIIRGLNASTDGSSIILGGGANNNDSAYVDLPNGLISSQTKITMAGWVKVSAIANWARIVDFGASGGQEVPPAAVGNGSEYLFYSASNGTNQSEQRLALKDDPGGESFYNMAYTTPLEAETFFAFTIDSTSGDSSVYNLYRDGQWGIRFLNATYTLGSINDVNCWLGRSQFAGDPQLQGSFNEFRIYNGTLNERAIRALHATGPNDILDLYSVTRSGNQLILNFESRETLTYAVESSPDLSTWTRDATGVPGEAGTDTTTVTVPVSAGRKYFRIRLED